MSRGVASAAVTIWLQGSRHELCKKKHQAQKADKLFTGAVPQKLPGIIVFLDERVNGEECVQTAAFLKTKKGAMPENHFPDPTWQAPQARGTLKRPLEAPKPLHTIEQITETCHDARLYFLLMGLEASFAKGLASLTQLVSHDKHKWLEPVASFCPIPAVKMAGRVRSFMKWDPADVGHLYEEEAP